MYGCPLNIHVHYSEDIDKNLSVYLPELPLPPFLPAPSQAADTSGASPWKDFMCETKITLFSLWSSTKSQKQNIDVHGDRAKMRECVRIIWQHWPFLEPDVSFPDPLIFTHGHLTKMFFVIWNNLNKQRLNKKNCKKRQWEKGKVLSREGLTLTSQKRKTKKVPFEGKRLTP